MGWPFRWMGWLYSHVRKRFVSQRAVLNVYRIVNLAYTDKQFAFSVRAFPEESVGICELYLFNIGVFWA
jgi:hypothetical protein